MVGAYDTLVLADVHATISYYLRHRDEVRAYLKRREEEAEALRVKIKADRSRVSREELLARWSAREKANAPSGARFTSRYPNESISWLHFSGEIRPTPPNQARNWQTVAFFSGNSTHSANCLSWRREWQRAIVLDVRAFFGPPPIAWLGGKRGGSACLLWLCVVSRRGHHPFLGRYLFPPRIPVTSISCTLQLKVTLSVKIKKGLP